ncbi:MAG: zinc ABC transporter substrate-binding protein [Treponema sp.]|nr:zinc ABC transporter substrate-binding protein [Treponema sp.]
MKKIYTMFIAVAVIFSFAACHKKTTDGKLKVVATIFPEYDWVRNILGEQADHAELTLLLDNGVDLHSYQPSVKDMAKLSVADIFVYVGGESDEWVEDALKTVRNKNIRVVNLLEVLGDKVKEEEIVEGMQVEEDDEHEHEGEEHHHEGEGHHHHDDEEEIEYDEHVWLSIKNARLLCAAIAEELCAADEKNAAMYRKNLSAYDEKLAALDADYTAAVKSAVRKTLLFGDRFPFRYLTDDYGLHYYAAFVGCSAETEASFKTVAFLSAKADELSLPAVLQIETGDGKIAGTIIQNTKAKSAKILTLDSMQSTTAKQIAAGTTYLGIMEKNLAVLEEALGE